ncbi:MAG: low molecular weight phosphotyrosine protein phosphatase [Porticoccaceae bacterium]|nr:low molecular weight phosphotyrosine protein phosphatase [Porticoccaceae bacterium]
MSKLSVLFVCLGNICRSPTAHAVFRQMVSAQGLDSKIQVDSAGTGDWHLGYAPDARSTATAAERGYDLSDLRARLVTPSDFAHFDYIIAMDNSNLDNLQVMCPGGFSGELKLFLDYTGKERYSDYTEVPDPYLGGADGFELVLDLIEDASLGLLGRIKAQLQQSDRVMG